MDNPSAVFDATTLTSVLVGSILPWLIAKITSSQWGAQTRAIVSFLVCLVFGVVVAYLGKTFTGTWSDDPQVNIYVVVYNFIWLLGSAWTTFSRFWVNIPAFQRVQEKA